MAKIAVFLGSIREGRSGEAVANWVIDQAASRDHDYELIDLKDYQLPLLATPVVPAQAKGNYDNDEVQKFADKVRDFDGFIFVTAEYNHNVPGPMKNAFDSIAEWKGKPIGFVGYGFGGAEDAVKGWIMSTVDSSFEMPHAKSATQINIPDYFGDNGFAADDKLNDALSATFDDIEALAAK